MQEDSLHDIVRRAEHSMVRDPVKTGKHVTFTHYDIVEKIHAYLNSRHTTGEFDSLGREKPFFNIVNAAVNVWYRATDIDRKDLRFIPTTRKSVPLAFIANTILQKWMNEMRLGRFFNDWGRTLAEYGSAVCKFVEKDGKLHPSVIPWNRMIVDPIDFDALPRIEKLYFTPAQLKRKKEYDQDVVKELLDNLESRKDLEDQQKDLRDTFIEVYEVHGELSESVYKQAKGQEPAENDDDKYSQQVHIITYVQTEGGEVEDYTLFVAKESQDPYMLTHLIEQEGQTLSFYGAVTTLFDAQWMQNHTMKNLKDTLDLAGKLIFQTSDSKYLGRNILTHIETGDIMLHAPNQPLTQINNTKADITALQNFSAQWKQLAGELTSTPDAIKGNTLPSGTPYSLGAFLGAQANSLFELMTENKGLDMEEMMRRFVIPFIKKKLKNTDEIVAILDEAGIQEIDSIYIPNKAIKNYNKRVTEQILEGDIDNIQEFNPELEQMAVQQGLGGLGNKRFFKPSELGKKQWADIFSDFQWDSIRVEITNENVDKQAVLTTLASVFQTVASNPQVLQDENAKTVFNAILRETGRISPMQLTSRNAVTPPAKQMRGDLESVAQTEQNAGGE